MKLDAIFWTDPYGETELIAITNDSKRWLEINNKLRVGDGEDPESITDFTIEEVNADIFLPIDTEASGFGNLEGNLEEEPEYVEEWTTSIKVNGKYENPDKYESITRDNEDYFVQEEEE